MVANIYVLASLRASTRNLQPSNHQLTLRNIPIQYSYLLIYMCNLIAMIYCIFQGLSVVGVQQIDRVVDVVEETLKGNIIHSVYLFMPNDF